MDIQKQFQEYLPKWCEENNVPKAKMESKDVWILAWKSFTETFLVENWQQVNQEYKEMKLRTVGESKQLIKDKSKPVQTPTQDTPQSSTEQSQSTSNDWDIVSKYLQELD